jgi:hypothetical protein
LFTAGGPRPILFTLGVEMIVTLQDVLMILALPTSGDPLYFSTKSKGWRDSMRPLIGCAPLVKDMLACVPYTWIVLRYKRCPELAEKEVMQQYAYAYVWYVISRTLFADNGGRNAHWM